MRNKLIICFLILFAVPFCHAQQGSTDRGQSDEITALLELKKSLEKENKLGNEFTIQLFYGDLKSADEVMEDYNRFFTTWPISLEYETPNYKVWVGSFGNRLDADRVLLKLKEKFPSAFVLRPNIK